MTDLFREVEEDLRREQFSKLWEKYGIFVIGAAVAIVLVVAAIVGWRAWSHSSSVEASARYDELVASLQEDVPPEEAAAAFDKFAAETGGGYETLARLQQADRLLEAGERDAALAVYEEVANGASLGLVRGMATIKAGLIVVDTASYDDMKARMASVMSEESPWHGNALELLALVAMREGAWTEADGYVKRIIANPASPSGLRDRAHVIQALAAPHLPQPAAPADTATEGSAAEEAGTETSPEIQQTPAAEPPAETE
ncbi:tetratricopeptide repeat protein [Parvibaculum sp.]|uniref:tetratricopeptide repeat protein n=1 Tax=Parvibaculum sp. TaxID=2024848 RepID=UPI001B197A10|nr:tetratricopeptide repeat protein [Parvibaculum sp.]MBO6633582.1 tetratricopeptide repeat protein [Parvibaculum sp.]MBO6678881.1 tetratricopeptide repeat protein [Parvibaculum sp.]MBO6685791.1 tetratricopeptide repeat protein [Parvibaculum sp.]MBO6903389.1 tetratricopeptide repeat protein [Parvibaculum sp.]